MTRPSSSTLISSLNLHHEGNVVLDEQYPALSGITKIRDDLSELSRLAVLQT